MTSPPKASLLHNPSLSEIVPQDNLCLRAIAADVAAPAEREKGLLGQGLTTIGGVVQPKTLEP